MQFDEVPGVRFRNDARWRAGYKAVEFTIEIDHKGKRQEIPCRVSEEALADIVNQPQPLGGIEAEKIFKGSKRRIENVAARKFKAAEFEVDDSIVIRSGDLT